MNSRAAHLPKVASRKKRGEIYHTLKWDSDPVDLRRHCDGWKTELQNKKCICDDEAACKDKMMYLIKNGDNKRCALITVFKGPLLDTIRGEFPSHYIPNEKIFIRPHHFRDKDLLPNNKGPIDGKLPVDLIGANLIVVEEKDVTDENEVVDNMPDFHQPVAEASTAQSRRKFITMITPKKMVSAASLLMKRLRNSTGGRGKEKRQQSQHRSFQNEDQQEPDEILTQNEIQFDPNELLNEGRSQQVNTSKVDELEVLVNQIAVDGISPMKENIGSRNNMTSQEEGDILGSDAKEKPAKANFGIFGSSSVTYSNMDETTTREPQGWSQDEDISCVHDDESSDEEMGSSAAVQLLQASSSSEESQLDLSAQADGDQMSKSTQTDGDQINNGTQTQSHHDDSAEVLDQRNPDHSESMRLDVEEACDTLRKAFIEDTNRPIDRDVMDIAVQLLKRAQLEEANRRKSLSQSEQGNPNLTLQEDAQIFPVRHSSHPYITTFAIIKKPYKSKEGDDSLNRRSVQSFHDLREFLNVRCGDDPILKQKTIERYVTSSDGFVSWSGENYLDLTIEECLTIRENARLSAKQVYDVFNAVRILRGIKRFYPKGLRKLLGEFERDEGLCVESVMVEAEVGKGKSANCVFWYFTQLPRLLEILLAASIADGSYEFSSKFSNFSKANIFCRGIDRGGGDVIDMVRLVNRKKGNAGIYCAPISVLEDGSETYANLAKTTFNKKRRDFFDRLEEEKFHFFSIWAERRKNGQSGDVEINDDSDDDSDNDFDEDLDDDVSLEDEEVKKKKIEKDCLSHARAMAVEFSCPDTSSFAPKLLDVQTRLTKDCVLTTKQDLKDFEESSVNARDESRTMPTKIVLNAQMISHPPRNSSKESVKEGGSCFKLKVSITLVRYIERDEKTDDVTESLVGFKIIYNEKRYPFRSSELFRFYFDSPIVLSDKTRIKFNCQNSLLINSDDGKMSTTLAGLSTCSSKYACRKCIWETNYKQAKPVLPAYFRTEELEELLGPKTIAMVEFKDYAKRENEHAYEKSIANRIHRMGKNNEFSNVVDEKTDTKYKDMNHTCKSVRESPIRVEADLNMMTVDPMHTHQGGTTKVCEETISDIKKVAIEFGDEQLGWADGEIKKSRQEMELLIREYENHAGFQRGKEFMGRAIKSIIQHGKKLEKLRRTKSQLPPQSDMNEINRKIEEEMKEYESAIALKEHINKISSYGEMNKGLLGAKEFLELLNDETNNSKKMMSQPEFLFRQALQTYGGAFNKQHGTIELTERRGMKALQKRDLIYATVMEGSFKDNPEALAKLRKVMDWWLASVTPWYEIGLILKSQKKMTKSRVKDLKRKVASFLGVYIGQREYEWTKNPITWKLHTLVCCLIPFAELTGMIGRVSTEGFENNHFRIAAIKRLLSPMTNVAMRTRKIADRLICQFFPGVGPVWEYLMKSLSRGERGSYNVNRTNIAISENIERSDSDGFEYETFGNYFSTKSGYLLHNNYFELHRFLVNGAVPSAWISSFNKNGSGNLGTRAVMAAEHL